MNKNDILNIIVRRTNLNRTKVSTVVSEFLGLIKQSVIYREKVTLQGFGTFTTKHHSTRRGRSFTGDLITIPAYDAPTFRFSNTFKTALKEKNYSTDTLKSLDKFIKIESTDFTSEMRSYQRLVTLNRCKGTTNDFTAQIFLAFLSIIGKFHDLNQVLFFYSKSTTVMPAPPNCTCSSR